jgi:Icc-related predicted phosphoesterase
MRILIIGDIHGDLTFLASVVYACSNEELDLIILTGDFADVPPPQYLHSSTRDGSISPERMYQAQLTSLFNLLTILNLPIVYIPGNHDLPIDAEMNNDLCHNVDFLAGKTPFYFNNEIAIIGVGESTNTPFRGPYEWTDDNKLFKLLHYHLDNLNIDTWFLVSHCPPKWCRTIDVGYYKKQHLGSEQVRKLLALYKPKIVITGHVHEAAGVDIVDKSLVINSGSLTDIIPVSFPPALGIPNGTPSEVCKYYILDFNKKMVTYLLANVGLLFTQFLHLYILLSSITLKIN